MGDIYAIRSDVEHLHEHKYLEVFDRATRLDLMQKEAVAEYVARNTPGAHHRNAEPVAAFWELGAAAQILDIERRSTWEALGNRRHKSEGSPQWIRSGILSDGDLGGP